MGAYQCYHWGLNKKQAACQWANLNKKHHGRGTTFSWTQEKTMKDIYNADINYIWLLTVYLIIIFEVLKSVKVTCHNVSHACDICGSLISPTLLAALVH